MAIYDFFGILMWMIIILLIILVVLPIYKAFKHSKGKGRRISGEVLRDIGIALMVGAAFKWGILELTFYVAILLGMLFIIWGTIMKEDEK